METLIRRSWVLLGVLLIAVAASAQTQADFFNDTVLQDINLTMAPADWTRLKVNFQDSTDYPASFKWKGVTVAEMAIKQHGKGSRSGIKPSLKLDFNFYDDTQTFLGLTAVIMRANTEEASLINESVAMKFAQQLGVAFTREAPARLFVNGEYIGAYHIVESVDKVYVKTHYGEDTGYLYEAQRAQGIAFVYQVLGSSGDAYAPYFDPKTHETAPDFATIAAYVQAINSAAADSSLASSLSQYVDLKKFLMYLVPETYLADNDSFLSDPGMNNYYYYRYAGNKVSEYISWDRSNTFLGASTLSVMHNTDVNVLTKKALAVADLKATWLQGLSQAATFAGGAGGWLDKEIDRQFALIKDAALADPNKQCPTSSGVLAGCTNDQFLAAVAAMKTFAAQRYTNVTKELASMGVSTPPQVTSAGIVNAATFNAAPNNQVARGQIVSIFGSTFVAGGPFAAGSLPLPTSLGSTSVQVNGQAIPLVLVTGGQINAQLPFELNDTGTATLAVVSSGTSSSSATVNLQATSPGIFTVNSQGSGDGAILHADNTLVTAANPAKAGETVVIFCTGLGATNPPVASGKAAAGEKVVAATTVTIGGKDAPVAFAGLAPGFVGLYQVNVVVPAGVSGSSKVVITSAGNNSRSDVTIPIQ